MDDGLTIKEVAALLKLAEKTAYAMACQASVVWESVTPYVPSRHHLRGGKEREGESMAEQIGWELQRRGLSQVDLP